MLIFVVFFPCWPNLLSFAKALCHKDYYCKEIAQKQTTFFSRSNVKKSADFARTTRQNMSRNVMQTINLRKNYTTLWIHIQTISFYFQLLVVWSAFWDLRKSRTIEFGIAFLIPVYVRTGIWVQVIMVLTPTIKYFGTCSLWLCSQYLREFDILWGQEIFISLHFVVHWNFPYVKHLWLILRAGVVASTARFFFEPTLP